MRAVWLALLLAACTTPVERAPLLVDVLITQTKLRLWAHEADAPDPCTNPFPEIGTRDHETDGLGCDGGEPVEWIDGFRLDGRDVICAWMPPEWCTIDVRDLGALDDETLVIDTDRDEVRVALPATPRPVAAIDDVVDDGTTTTVVWSADPPAASVIALMAASERVHVIAGEPVTLDSVASPDVSGWIEIWALARPTTREAELGTVRIWVGGYAARDLGPL